MAGMFDDIILKARDLADAASKKTGELYEISKFKYECIRLNGEVKKLYEQLGSSVYYMIKEKYENNELVESLAEEIDERLARLKEINKIISEMKDVIECPICGSKNSVENIYCAKCGSKLKETYSAEQPEEEECCNEKEDCCCGCDADPEGGCDCGCDASGEDVKEDFEEK